MDKAASEKEEYILKNIKTNGRGEIMEFSLVHATGGKECTPDNPCKDCAHNTVEAAKGIE